MLLDGVIILWQTSYSPSL